MHQYKNFILNSLPFTDIKTNIYHKVNNKSELKIISSQGIPFGTIARLILLFITSQLVDQKSKKIFLGKTFSAFMKNCGYQVSGGNNGNMQRFKEQWKRLLSCNFQITDLDGKVISFNLTQRNNDFDGFLEVDDIFYNHLLKNKIYIDDKEFKKLSNGKYGSIMLDLYFWLIYRRYTLNKFTSLKYGDLKNQFGTDQKDIYCFKVKLKQAFIILATLLNFQINFFDESFRIIDFTIKNAFSNLYKFQGYLKDFILSEKYKFKICFEKEFMKLSIPKKLEWLNNN
jgi:hypothetical protein